MRVLAVEPFHGGSHKAFLDGWIEHSRHDWTVIGFPARHWRWRMRHAPLTAARLVGERLRDTRPAWDVLFCSEMLNLPEFLGLVPELTGIPTVAYFHENQLTYPEACRDEHDYHHAYSNILTAIRAQEVWFNSDYHCRTFFSAAKSFLERMPDSPETDALREARRRSHVRYPGIEPPPSASLADHQAKAPLRLLWAARWEADKRLDRFLDATSALAAEGLRFEVSVIGGSPPVAQEDYLEAARSRLGSRVSHWGFVSRPAYWQALAEADVIVSTADHEFFGIGVLEAVAAGACPLLPHRLAYPEIFGEFSQGPVFYDGTVEALQRHLRERIHMHEQGESLPASLPGRLIAHARSFRWSRLAPLYDDHLAAL